MSVKTAITAKGAGVQLAQVVVVRRLVTGETNPWGIILLTPNNGFVEQEDFATEAERDARFAFWMDSIENATTFADAVGGRWALTNAPAVGLPASVVKAAPGVGKVTIVTNIAISLTSGAADPGHSSLLFRLLDGATPIWSMRLDCDRNVMGGSRFGYPCSFASSLNTALTLETVGAISNAFATVAMNGHEE